MNKIKIEYSFVLMWSIFYFFDREGLLPVFFCAAVLHEMGHYIVMRLLGGQLIFLRLTAFGAEMRMTLPGGYLHEFLVAGAGPLSNFLTSYLLSVLGHPVAAGAGAVLGLFNLLPASPLDGGKILECLLCLSPFEDWAENITEGISFAIASLIFGAGIFVLFHSGCNASILLIGAFLLAGQCLTDIPFIRLKSFEKRG